MVTTVHHIQQYDQRPPASAEHVPLPKVLISLNNASHSFLQHRVCTLRSYLSLQNLRKLMSCNIRYGVQGSERTSANRYSRNQGSISLRI